MSWKLTQIDHGPPPSAAAINRSMSDFIWSNAPTREIDLAIVWLEEMASDCQRKIAALRQLKNDRDRASNHKAELRKLARLFDDPDFLNIDLDNQIKIIQQRIGCDYKRAESIHEYAIRAAKNRKIESRNLRILRLHKSGLPDKEIAGQVGLTRQQIHNILKKMDKGLL